MVNALYDNGRAEILRGNITMASFDMRALLVDHGVDTPNPVTDGNLSDIAAGARVAYSAADIGGQSVVAGVFDAADEVLANVSGATVESVSLVFDTGVEATSTLVLFLDTMTGLPLTPNGTNVTITWDNGANKIFNWQP